MISLIIPTYKNPEVLELCLRSAIEGQEQDNEILVIVDGCLEENLDVLEKYKDKIKPQILTENAGMSIAQNIGVEASTTGKVLVINDDNVLPRSWDTILDKYDLSDTVWAPNQIEPFPSIFKQFKIKDLGRNLSEFNLEKFWKYEESIREDCIEMNGCTYPILISKDNYQAVDGFDVDYPTKAGSVSDWDFFLKCELKGWKMLRTYQCSFYHFVSVSRKSEEEMKQAWETENKCKQFFADKWGVAPEHNPVTNSKMVKVKNG